MEIFRDKFQWFHKIYKHYNLIKDNIPLQQVHIFRFMSFTHRDILVQQRGVFP